MTNCPDCGSWPDQPHRSFCRRPIVVAKRRAPPVAPDSHFRDVPKVMTPTAPIASDMLGDVGGFAWDLKELFGSLNMEAVREKMDAVRERMRRNAPAPKPRPAVVPWQLPFTLSFVDERAQAFRDGGVVDVASCVSQRFVTQKMIFTCVRDNEMVPHREAAEILSMKVGSNAFSGAEVRLPQIEDAPELPDSGLLKIEGVAIPICNWVSLKIRIAPRVKWLGTIFGNVHRTP